jgi:hypothetical protein
MERIMSKTNGNSNIATVEHDRRLADTELDAVTSGFGGLGSGAMESCVISALVPQPRGR